MAEVELRDLTKAEMNMVYELLGRGSREEGKTVVVMFYLALREPVLAQWIVDQSLRRSPRKREAKEHGEAAMRALKLGVVGVLEGIHPSQKMLALFGDSGPTGPEGGRHGR